MRLAGAGASRIRSGYLRALLSGQLALVVTAAAQLIAVPLQIEIAGVEGFGIVSLAVTWLGIAGMGAGWLTSGGVRRLGETRAVDDEAGYASARMVVRFGSAAYGMFLAVATGIVGVLMRDSIPAPLADGWYVAVGWMAVMAFLQYEQAGRVIELTANQRQAVCNLAVVAYHGAVLLMLGWSAAHTQRGLPPVFMALAAGFLAARVVLFFGARDRPVVGVSGVDAWKEGLRSLFNRRGGGYSLHGALTQLQYADLALVGWLGGAHAAGQFSALWRIPSVIVQVFWRVPAYLEPYVIEADARGDRERQRRWYRRGERIYLAAGAAAALGFAIFGRDIIRFWLGSTFAGEPWQYWLAGGAAFWLTAIRWPINFLHAEARLRELLVWQGTEVGLRFLLTVMLFSVLEVAAPWAATIAVVGMLSFWKYRSIAKR